MVYFRIPFLTLLPVPFRGLGFKPVSILFSPLPFAENTYIFSVPRDSAVRPFVVGRVRATDADVGINGQLRYRLRNATGPGLEAFGVDARSGQIRVRTNKRLDKDK